jgi:hypothetical protein
LDSPFHGDPPKRRAIAAETGIRDQDFVVVPTVIATILVLVTHKANDAVRLFVDSDNLSQWISSFFEQLLADLIAEDANPKPLFHIGPRNVPALGRRKISNT